MPERLSRILLAALVAQIPFEFRYTLFGLTNLQWTFLVLAVVSAPVVLKNRRDLIRNRLIQAAAIFVAIQWLAAFLAPEFNTNALKGAIRFSAGLMLLAVGAVYGRPRSLSEDIAGGHRPPLQSIHRTWVISASLAAAYALLDYAGIGASRLFRESEFFIGQIQRLSGSFEYPNTAAAYFAMSLPIVWWSEFPRVLKWTFAFLLWCAVVLTFSKGALAAIAIATLGAAIISRSKPTAALLGVGLLAYLALLPVNPYLVERLRGPGVRNPIAAEYQPAWNRLEQQPATTDQVPLHIRNTGVSEWRADGLWRVAIAYRWWNRDSETFVGSITPLITSLPRDVERGETVDVSASFETPAEPGRYILVVELFSRNFDWFSRTGVVPTLIQVDVQPSAMRSVGHTDLSSLYRRGQNPGRLTASVSRSSLWSAALKMFVAHPLGVGPDNYRLQYGKYLNAQQWDTSIYSNNLYLELLAGSGILGLTAFGFVLVRIPWRIHAVTVALAIYLMHGVVDVFLMTTPIYFTFWTLAGLSVNRSISTEPFPLLSEEGWLRG